MNQVFRICLREFKTCKTQGIMCRHSSGNIQMKLDAAAMATRWKYCCCGEQEQLQRLRV